MINDIKVCNGSSLPKSIVIFCISVCHCCNILCMEWRWRYEGTVGAEFSLLQHIYIVVVAVVVSFSRQFSLSNDGHPFDAMHASAESPTRSHHRHFLEIIGIAHCIVLILIHTHMGKINSRSNDWPTAKQKKVKVHRKRRWSSIRICKKHVIQKMKNIRNLFDASAGRSICVTTVTSVKNLHGDCCRAKTMCSPYAIAS